MQIIEDIMKIIVSCNVRSHAVLNSLLCRKILLFVNKEVHTSGEYSGISCYGKKK